MSEKYFMSGDSDIFGYLHDYLSDKYNHEDLELIVHDEVKNINTNQRVFVDACIIYKKTGQIIAIFEYGFGHSKSIKNSEYINLQTNLLAVSNKTKIPVYGIFIPLDEVLINSEDNRITKDVYNTDNIHFYQLKKDKLEKIVELPSYEILRAGIKAKAIIEEKTKQKKNLNVIAIKSWVIILTGIALLVLDSLDKYKITSERMGFMLFLVILLYIPNISEISIANFSLKLINSKEEEEKDSEK